MEEEIRNIEHTVSDDEGRRALLSAIKRDDARAFGTFACPEVFSAVFGRFPLLSLLYLFDAKNILKRYLPDLIKERPRRAEPTFREADRLFLRKAGKPLRYFADREVSPLEMLAVLGRPKELKALYARYPNASKYLPMIHKIYFTRRGVGVTVVGDKLILPREPLPIAEKRMLALFGGVFLGIFLCVIGLLSFFLVHYGLGTENMPYLARSAAMMEDALAHDRSIVLKEDITLSSSVGEYAAKMDGEDHFIHLSAPFAEKLQGSVENVIFVIEKDFVGDAVILENAGTLRNVRVIAEEVSLTQSVSAKGLMTVTNLGTIENCYAVINVSVVGEGSTDGCFAPFAGRNEGSINNCHTDGIIKTTNIDVSALVGENEKNGTITDCTIKAKISGSSESGFLPQAEGIEEKESPEIGGVAVRNKGAIYGCTVTGSIETKNIDLAGVALENESTGTITNCTVDLALRQDADIVNWTPNVAGVSMHNDGTIKGCVISGEITSVLALSTLDEEQDAASAYAAGVACVNGGVIKECKLQEGTTVFAQATNGYPMAGGIVTINAHYAEKEEDYLFGTLENCMSNGTVNVISDRFTGYVGGIAAQNPRLCRIEGSNVSGSVSGVLTASPVEENENVEALYAGGVTAVNIATIKDCENRAEISSEATNAAAFAGGIVALNSAAQGYFEVYSGVVVHCVGKGVVRAHADVYNAYAGGIAAQNHQNASISACRQDESVRATSDKENLFDFTGGIVGRNYGSVQSSFFLGTLDAYDEDSAIGAICGLVCLYVGGSIFTGYTYTLPLFENAYVDESAHTSGAVIVSGGTYKSALKQNVIYSAQWLEENEGYTSFVDEILEFGASSVTEEELKTMEIYYE